MYSLPLVNNPLLRPSQTALLLKLSQQAQLLAAKMGKKHKVINLLKLPPKMQARNQAQSNLANQMPPRSQPMLRKTRRLLKQTLKLQKAKTEKMQKTLKTP